MFTKFALSDHSTERHAESIAPKVTETTLTSVQQRKFGGTSSKRAKKHSEAEAVTSAFLSAQPERLSFTLQGPKEGKNQEQLPNKSYIT